MLKKGVRLRQGYGRQASGIAERARRLREGMFFEHSLPLTMRDSSGAFIGC